jgi:hypothetical protein
VSNTRTQPTAPEVRLHSCTIDFLPGCVPQLQLDHVLLHIEPIWAIVHSDSSLCVRSKLARHNHRLPGTRSANKNNFETGVRVLLTNKYSIIPHTILRELRIHRSIRITISLDEPSLYVTRR